MTARLARRRLLQGAALLGLPGLGRAAADAGLALHALNRLGYGPRPGELAALQAGFDWQAQVETQLQGQPLPADLQARLQQLAAQQPPPAELMRRYRELSSRRQVDENGAEKLRALSQAQLQLAAQTRLLRALESPNQLEERLVEFWFNHFNVFANKGLCRVLIADYEAVAIRPYVLGRFRDLLGATARHPAMLVYLDNWLSRADALNENYARELMELHTLGVQGGYTQRDVVELARVFSGWSLDRSDGGDGFRFQPRRHDEGAKTWLGHGVPGRGQAQGEWALDQLARHPRTANHLVFKLAQFFVADRPAPALVAATAEAFLASDGDLRATTRALLLHPDARDPAVIGAQFKSPYRYLLSLLRAVDHRPVDAQGWRPLLQGLRALGQPLYGCVSPDGWKCTREAWLDPESLAKRSELASRLGERLRPDVQQLLATLGSGLGERSRRLIAAEPAQLQAALLLASPDFQNA